jgi:hypothetical protein
MSEANNIPLWSGQGEEKTKSGKSSSLLRNSAVFQETTCRTFKI